MVAKTKAMTLTKGTTVISEQPYPFATRAQVEAKVKEMGFSTLKSGGYWKVNGFYQIVKGNHGSYGVLQDETMWIEQFDTAPEQLAEAILVARMLNATKD